jgi:hypothetical protein
VIGFEYVMQYMAALGFRSDWTKQPEFQIEAHHLMS